MRIILPVEAWKWKIKTPRAKKTARFAVTLDGISKKNMKDSRTGETSIGLQKNQRRQVRRDEPSRRTGGGCFRKGCGQDIFGLGACGGPAREVLARGHRRLCQQTEVVQVVVDLLLGDQAVLGVNRDLPL
ncbi:MAG: hypothetical protein OXE53_07925 [Deltaproteobacteria bacterium]|nr:hypothetical protein [Deltaproteobacteria bacterium]